MSDKSPFVLLTCMLFAGSVLAQETAEKKNDEEALTYGDTIVVTGSRVEEKIADAPVSLSVITAERLESSPGSNFADLVRGVPGVNVIQTSARDFNFTARGATSTLSTSQLALVDGRSIYQDFFGFVMWDLVPVSMDEIAQIEIQRGPGSAVWGANAMNGVINIITKSPAELAGGSAMFQIGEIGTIGGTARWAAVHDKWSYKLAGGYFEQDAWERKSTLPNGDPFPPGTNFKNEGTKQPKFDARLDYQQDENTRWTFGGGLALTSGLIHTGIGPFSVDDSTKVGYAKIGCERGSAQFSLYTNLLDGQGNNLINGLDFVFDTTTVHGEYVDRRALGDRQVITYGLSVRKSYFDLSIAPLEDQRTEFGLFVEDQIMFNDKVKLSVGGRVDHFNTIGSTFSPRTSLLLKPLPDHTLRLAYNRAYRAPSLVNNYLDTAIPNSITFGPGLPLPPFTWMIAADGDPDLDESVLDAFEVGYTVDIPGKATLTAAVYRNNTKDLINFAPVAFYSAANPPPGWPLPPAFVPPNKLPSRFTYVNTGEVVDKGLELSADFGLAKGIDATLSYTYQAEPEVTNDTTGAGLDLGTPPTNQFAAQVNFRRGIWFGNAGVSFTDKALWTDVLDSRFWGETDSYTLTNASLGARWRNLTLLVKGTNLFDEEIQQHIFGDIVRRRVVAEARTNF